MSFISRDKKYCLNYSVSFVIYTFKICTVNDLALVVEVIVFFVYCFNCNLPRKNQYNERKLYV